MANTAIQPVTVKLEMDIRKRMKHLAETRQRSTHWIMREAIKQYVEREEKREALRQDAILAWEQYQLTGLHVSFEEAEAWLGKLEEGQDLEPPECHA